MSKMNDTKGSKKDKNQHIQVFVRVRPTNATERCSKSNIVVEVPSNKEVVVKEKPHDKMTKKFTFDKVFGPESKQLDVYKTIVSPLLEEVLAGYNCTVFAYGQTGTGKTFTMEGLPSDPSLQWQTDTEAGIIPRSLNHLFDELRLLEDAQEYTVRVSFLELYNEELFDLLSPNDDASKIRLYEDTTKKGAVIIHGLEEVTVHNKNEVYKILEKGSEKRRTAATLMNAQSSRSHTVFSITVHIKENTVDGEELLKTGKLNLVDLAGSENIGRSGAVDRRAREAGNINQSLLTLGRVITALVERTPHIPYRESKLTRLLQESLGGRTKTSIIATISPSSINLEETLSTLDYAHRAKNITNRPEINQKLSKKALLKEYTEEIERLRRDLLATREKNGVYLAQENFNEMQTTIEFQSKELEEKINHIKALEETMVNKEAIFNELQSHYEQKILELNTTKCKLKSTMGVLKKTTKVLHEAENQRDEQKHLVEKHARTEKILLSQANDILKVADEAATDTYKLHEKLDRKRKVEKENESLGYQFKQNIGNSFGNVQNDLSSFSQQLIQFCLSMKQQMSMQSNVHKNNFDELLNIIVEDLMNKGKQMIEELSLKINTTHNSYKSLFENEIKTVGDITDEERKRLMYIMEKLSPRINALVKLDIADSLKDLNDTICNRLVQLSKHEKEGVDSFCNARLKERDYLIENIQQLNKEMETLLNNHQQYNVKRQNFAKMFQNMYLEFNHLTNDHEQYSSLLTNKVNSMSGIFTEITNYANQTSDENIKYRNQLQNHVESEINSISDYISTTLEQNHIVASNAEREGEILIEELEEDIRQACSRNEGIRDKLNSNLTNFKEKAIQDENEFITSLQKIQAQVSDTCVRSISLIETHKKHITKEFETIQQNLDSQNTESSECSNQIITKLNVTQHEIDKFLHQDLRKDLPTGSTPVRKEFDYPNTFVRTSPHERIIQRFRETRGMLHTPDKESTTSSLDSTLTDVDVFMTPNVNQNSTHHSKEIVDRAFSTPIDDNITNTTMKQNFGHYLRRSSSIPDLSDHSLNGMRTLSATNLRTENVNKENSDDEIHSAGKVHKRNLKLTKSNVRILGNHN